MILGGHQGHFAQVSFKWNYASETSPSLIVLHEGRVVYCGKMGQKKGSGPNCAADSLGRAVNSDVEDEIYELDVVSENTLKNHSQKLAYQTIKLEP